MTPGRGFPAWLSAGPLALALTSPTRAEASGPPGRWWKGNLHTHSLWSDGDDYPEMIADWYKQKGYNFVVLSDHNLLSEGQHWLELKAPGNFAGRVQEQGGGRVLEKYLARFGSDWVEQRNIAGKEEVRLKPLDEFSALLDEAGRFLLAPGYELTTKWGSAGAEGPGGPIHLTVLNSRHVAEVAGAGSAKQTIKDNVAAMMQQAGRDGQSVYTHLNHPIFSWSITLGDLIADTEISFMEIYSEPPLMHNRGDEAHPGTGRLWWDHALTARLRNSAGDVPYGVAADDAHECHVAGGGQGNPGRGWIMVGTDRLTPESLLHALVAGEFYATTGVVLADVRRDANRLCVEVVTEPGVEYTIQFIGSTGDSPTAIGVLLVEFIGSKAEYVMNGGEQYVRARIISSKAQANPVSPYDHETAWTQPVVPVRTTVNKA